MQARSSAPLWLAVVSLDSLNPQAGADDWERLQQIGHWAFAVTHQISLEPPDTVFLEVGGSLRLFGGYEAVDQRVRDGLEALGFQAARGAAPTPQGARLLARANHPEPIRSLPALRRRLLPLPCHLLDDTPEALQRLQSLELHTIGDCLRMPRGGLRRRIGVHWVRRLEQALGERADPRCPLSPPQEYTARLELPDRAASTRGIHFALQRLLCGLSATLRGTDSGIQQAELVLEHHRSPETRLSLGFLRPTRDAEHIGSVAHHRLERIRLPEPAVAIRLRADQFLPYHAESGQLFTGPGGNPDELQRLTERLVARLGPERVGHLTATPDPRPERAWSRQPLHQAPLAVPALLPRPAWLLPRPRPLSVHSGVPFWRGPLHLLAGPERIESGWWDGGDTRRDYYIARNPGGSRLWIFQEHGRSSAWHLHGLYG